LYASVLLCSVASPGGPVTETTIQRESSTPIYRQIHRVLREEILAGRYGGDDAPIPTEHALAATFEVSRVTVRKALAILAAEGLIVRSPGKGTFVAPPAIEEEQRSLLGLAEQMTRVPGQRMEVLSLETVTPPGAIAEQLRLAQKERVVRLHRLHLVRDEPVALAIVHLPYRVGRSFTVDELSRTPIYALIAQKTDERVARATQRVTAIAAAQEVAAALHVPPGAPILLIRRLTVGRDGRPLEHIALAYKGGRHELVMDLDRSERGSS
jgi:GntR family transcriptional regulator